MEVVTPGQGADAILYSIVIPVYNEVEVLPVLYDRLTRVMEGLREPYEIIFVNDGSQMIPLSSCETFRRGMNG